MQARLTERAGSRRAVRHATRRRSGPPAPTRASRPRAGQSGAGRGRRGQAGLDVETSPPASVQARPVATPGSRTVRACSRKNRSGPSISARFSGSTRSVVSRPGRPSGRPCAPPGRASARGRAPRLRGYSRLMIRRTLRGDRELNRRQPGLGQLPRGEVVHGDLLLFLLAIAGEPEDFHAIEQRGRDDVEGVGRGDEEDLRQVERHVEVVVAEGRVLGRVEDLEQGRRSGRRGSLGRACRSRRASARDC